MGQLDHFSSFLRNKVGSISIMFRIVAVLLLSAFAQARHLSGHADCTLNYDILLEEKCHHEEVCHEEHEVIVTTTVIEECEDIVTKHCHNEHKNVYHTTNIVGHDTAVVGHEVGHSYGGHVHHKREAAGGLHHSSGPECKDHHKVPHKKCHSKPICHPIEVSVPREICISIG